MYTLVKEYTMVDMKVEACTAGTGRRVKEPLQELMVPIQPHMKSLILTTPAVYCLGSYSLSISYPIVQSG